MPPNKENAPPATHRVISHATQDAAAAKKGKKRARNADGSDEEDVQPEVYRLNKRARGAKSDRLIHHGRHFGRTVLTFVNMYNLIDNGVARQLQMTGAGAELEDLETDSERQEHELFLLLLKTVPGLETRLFALEQTEDEALYCAEMLTRGVNTARADDVKSLKAAVIDFITPSGGVLTPSLPRNTKQGRGFHHDVTGRYLCPTDYDWGDEKVRQSLRTGETVVSGLQWPRLLYAGDCNPDDMWEGLLRSRILVQAYKHVFTSPSSVDGQNKATRSGNAQLHGMKSVTIPSIVYIATLVRFSLTSAGPFSRTDSTTDSERFYNTLLEFLQCEDEATQVQALLVWWDKQIFPGHATFGQTSLPKTSALALLKEQRLKRALADAEPTNGQTDD